MWYSYFYISIRARIMSLHIDHILTTDLREAYRYLIDMGELEQWFEVSEKGPSPKRSVNFKYAGKRTTPFAFIVNSGERKDYHLFYLRLPRMGNKQRAEDMFGQEIVNENPKGEITIQIRNLSDAEKVWRLVDEVRLK